MALLAYDHLFDISLHWDQQSLVAPWIGTETAGIGPYGLPSRKGQLPQSKSAKAQSLVASDPSGLESARNSGTASRRLRRRRPPARRGRSRASRAGCPLRGGLRSARDGLRSDSEHGPRISSGATSLSCRLASPRCSAISPGFSASQQASSSLPDGSSRCFGPGPSARSEDAGSRRTAGSARAHIRLCMPGWKRCAVTATSRQEVA